MDVKQKYINPKFTLSEWFAETLSEYPESITEDITKKIYYSIPHIPKLEGYTQIIGATAIDFSTSKHKDDEHFFFEVELLNESGSKPIFFELLEISMDEYLEMYKNKNTIEYFKKLNHEY